MKFKEDYLRKLPLLNHLLDLSISINLKNVYIICAQHIVSTTYSLFYSLIEAGLAPKNLSAIGKCYSSDPKALEQMLGLGIDVCPLSVEFDSYISFDEQYRQNIRIFVEKRLERLKSKQFEKIIILDDGGELISFVNEKLECNGKHIGIEQTSSGYHKLQEVELKFPVINVARSMAKLDHESPIIAKLVVSTLLDHLDQFITSHSTALIIGNGAIGYPISQKLKSRCPVSIYDTVPSKSSIEREDFKKSLKKFDIIVGCTGKKILCESDYHFLKPNSALVSASSSDREFDAVNLRKKLPKVKDCHENLRVDDFHLINCGFPVNFSAEFRKIDVDELQLTRALLLGSIFQAYQYQEIMSDKFIDLDHSMQREILSKFHSLFPENLPRKIV